MLGERTDSLMKVPLRSPSEKIGYLYYFGRMLDKIRLHARGELPEEYQPNLGKGFDKKCVDLLKVDYEKLVERVKQGGGDEEILQWCFETGHKPEKEEIQVWNEFMRKLGWNDKATETLIGRKRESGLSDRADIQTMFQYIDVDEGRDILPA